MSLNHHTLPYGIISIAAALLLLGTSAACQSRSEPALFNAVWTLVAEHHYDPGIFPRWKTLGDRYRALARQAGSDEESLAHINAMLNELGDSHCAVGRLAEVARASSPYLFADGTVGIDIRILDDEVLVSDVDAGSSADDSGIKPGFRLVAIDNVAVQQIAAEANQRPPATAANIRFHQAEAILWRLFGSAGTPVSIEYVDATDRLQVTTLTRTPRSGGVELYDGMPLVYLDEKQRNLDGGIHLLHFNAFQPEQPAAILGAIDRLDRDQPLIIDLRGNNGGSANATAEILGRFATSRFEAYSRVSRRQTIDIHVNPHTSAHRGPVVVMVDEMSISAAENFAAIMQHAKLATIVGTRTPGQLLWGEGFELGDGYLAVIPTARIRYPDGTDIEGRGVQPDHEVSLNRDDLLNGVDSQLQAAIAMLQNRTAEPSGVNTKPQD